MYMHTYQIVTFRVREKPFDSINRGNGGQLLERNSVAKNERAKGLVYELVVMLCIMVYKLCVCVYVFPLFWHFSFDLCASFPELIPHCPAC